MKKIILSAALTATMLTYSFASTSVIKADKKDIGGADYRADKKDIGGADYRADKKDIGGADYKADKKDIGGAD